MPPPFPQALRDATPPSVRIETLAYLTAVPPLGTSQQSIFGGISRTNSRDVLDDGPPLPDPLEEYLSKPCVGLELGVEYTQSDPVLGRPPSPNYAIMTTPPTQTGSHTSLSPQERSPHVLVSLLPGLGGLDMPQSTPTTSNGSANSGSPLPLGMMSPPPLIPIPETKKDKGKGKLMYSPPRSPTPRAAVTHSTEQEFADANFPPFLRRSAALAAEAKISTYGATSSKHQRGADDNVEDEEFTSPPVKKLRVAGSKVSSSRGRLDNSDGTKNRVPIPSRDKTGTRGKGSSSKLLRDNDEDEAFAPSGSTMRSSATPKASSSKRPRDDDDDDDEYGTRSAKMPRTQSKPSSSRLRGTKTRKNPVTHSDDDSDEVTHRSDDRYYCTWSGCTKSFSRYQDVERHIKTVHNKSAQYKCKKCHGTFSRKDALDRHVRTKHPEGDDQDDPPAA